MQRCVFFQVREALASKVSRERVGTELEGMFKGAAIFPRGLFSHFPISLDYSGSIHSGGLRFMPRATHLDSR